MQRFWTLQPLHPGLCSAPGLLQLLLPEPQNAPGSLQLLLPEPQNAPGSLQLLLLLLLVPQNAPASLQLQLVLPDAPASLRLLLPGDDEKACYDAMRAVHRLWTSTGRDYKDYVAAPKANGKRAAKKEEKAGLLEGVVLSS